MTGRKRKFTEEFKCEAVRLSHESGLTIDKIASDLGVGKSTLTAWRRKFRGVEREVDPDEAPAKEIARLRRENDILRQERDLLKKATALFAKDQNR